MAKIKSAEKPPKGPKMGEFLISKAHQLARPRSIHLVGEPGRGKSTLAATIAGVPGIDRVLMLDIDFGSAAIAQDFPDIDIVTFRKGDWKTLERFWNTLVSNDGDGYDAVIVDTMTKAQSWKEKGTPAGTNKFEKWATVKDWTINMLEELHEMAPVGLALFHTEYTNMMRGSDDKEYYKLGPMLAGSAKSLIGGIPDIIGFCDVVELDEDDDDYEEGVNELQYTVRLQPGEKTNTKNRFKLPPVVDASGGFPRIYQMIAERSKKGAK